MKLPYRLLILLVSLSFITGIIWMCIYHPLALVITIFGVIIGIPALILIGIPFLWLVFNILWGLLIFLVWCITGKWYWVKGYQESWELFGSLYDSMPF